MKSTIFGLICLLYFLPISVQGQQQTALRGLVLDLENSLPLPGAVVYWEGNQNGAVVTGSDGGFEIDVKDLPSKLTISFLGYEVAVREIQKKEVGKSIRFFLRQNEMDLDEVVINEFRPEERVKNLETGKASVAIETIKNIPALFGEVDLLRSLQLLPGVQSAGEGTTGLFVRGGSADQNLVQIDGAPVYNPSHFFGFFSVFNPDALSGVDLYKGNMPAQFGGRLSSLIDVSLREGNTAQLHGEGGIGTISSRLTLDGPLFSDRSTFVVSARRTYADVFLGLSSNEDIRNNKLNFHDLSAKVVFKVSDRDRLSMSSYQGRDFLGFDDQFGLGWSNWASALTWNRTIQKNFYFDLNAYHTSYQYELNLDDPENGFDWNNQLTESGIKALWSKFIKNHQINWGVHTQLYRFLPIKVDPASGNTFQGIATNPKNGLLTNAFAGGTVEISPRLSAEGGVRWGLFNQLGNGVRYEYENGTPSPDSEIVDSVRFDRFESMQFYEGLEPRLAFRYMVDREFSIKAAYNRNFQYVQIASNSSAGLPIDRWILADAYIRPSRSDQFSLGFFKNIEKKGVELSLEGYYKSLSDIIDLRNGAQVLFTDNVETEILSGKGWSYGVEFLARKNTGRTSGWFAYTYSRAWRQLEGISRGRAYNPRFDRPHDLTLVLNHEFSKNWSLGFTFVYATGQAVSFPIGTYIADNQRVPYFSPYRNEDRFPDYHRMDASLTWDRPTKGKKWRGSWNFSIYNLYGRKNPFSYEFRQIINDDIGFDPQADGAITNSRQGIVMTYLFTFLPSITYNFNF